MTRKDYIKLAALIAEEYSQTCGNNDKHCQITQLKFGIADILAHDNPKFNRAKFYQACEPGVTL